VREAIQVTGAKNKTSAQLERVLSQFVLRMPGGLGSHPRRGIVFPHKVKQIRTLQFQCLIRLALFVHQQRKGDSRLFAECAGVGAVAQPDGCKSRSTFAKCRFLAAQLRDVLAAENSTIVAQEHDDGRLPQPKRTEANFAPVAIRQVDQGDPAVQGGVHVSILATTNRLSRSLCAPDVEA
jgi:hypothetical protein